MLGAPHCRRVTAQGGETGNVMRITIELEPGDVERFLKALARSRRIAEEADETDILAAAKEALNTLLIGTAPEYVRKRMIGVQRLIMMVEDDAWALPQPERLEVLEALVYFSDPDGNSWALQEIPG